MQGLADGAVFLERPLHVETGDEMAKLPRHDVFPPDDIACVHVMNLAGLTHVWSDLFRPDRKLVVLGHELESDQAFLLESR